MSIIERILYALELRDKKMVDLSILLSINTSTIANWKTRNTDPPAKYIAPICEFLNISINWLLTGEGDLNRIIQTNIPPPDKIIDFDEFNNLKQDEKIMIRCYREITDKGKDEATKMMLDLRDEYKIPKPKQPGTLSHSHVNDDTFTDFETADDLTYHTTNRYKDMANAV